MPKNQVNLTRENNNPAAFGKKPQLDEKDGAGLRGQDKQQGDLKRPSEMQPESDVTGEVGSQGGM